jgi:hypothetical protein
MCISVWEDDAAMRLGGQKFDPLPFILRANLSICLQILLENCSGIVL